MTDRPNDCAELRCFLVRVAATPLLQAAAPPPFPAPQTLCVSSRLLSSGLPHRADLSRALLQHVLVWRSRRSAAVLPRPVTPAQPLGRTRRAVDAGTRPSRAQLLPSPLLPPVRPSRRLTCAPCSFPRLLSRQSPQPGNDYCHSPAGPGGGHSAPAQLQHTSGYPPTSQSPLVQSYPRQPPHPGQAGRNRQQLHTQPVPFSPNDGAYLPSPLESPSFRVEPTLGHHSPAPPGVGAFAGPLTAPSSADLSPYPSYDGEGAYGQQAHNDLYPFNSRPPDMSTSLSSAWSYPITTPPSSTASSFRQCVSRSTSPSAASVMSAYSSAASSASAPQGYHAITATRAARSSPYHFRNRATSTPSLATTAGASTGPPAATTTVKVPTPRGGKVSSKVVIAGDRSAAQRNKAKLTDAQKKEICTLKLETPNIRQDDLAARFGVERSTVSKILKDTARWMNPAAWLPERRKESAAATSVPFVSLFRLRAAPVAPSLTSVVSFFPASSITRFVELEGPLTVWLHAQSSHGDRNPPDQTIKERALEIASSLGWPAEKFKASSGWLDGFKARHDLFKHAQHSGSDGTPSASTSRRSSPVKKTTSPLQQVVASASSVAASSPAPSLASSTTPTLKEGFEYTARKRSSSSVSLRANVPNLPTVLEDCHFIAQPLPRRAGQLGRSESLAMMASMENVSLAGGPPSVKPGRPGLSPLTPSSSSAAAAAHRPLPQRSLSFPTGGSAASGPVTPASVEGSLGIATSVYVSASPSEPPPPAAPFEARRHHQRLHSQSGLNSPSSGFQPAAFADNAWFSYPSPQEHAFQQQQQQQHYHHQQQQAYDAEHQRLEAMPKTFAQHGALQSQQQQVADYGGVSYGFHSPAAGQEPPTFVFNGSADPMLSAGGDYRQAPSVSPSHSAVPSRLASPANSPGPQQSQGFARTRSYTGSSLALTSNYDATSPPDYQHAQPLQQQQHGPGPDPAAYMAPYEPAAEQSEVCFSWGETSY